MKTGEWVILREPGLLKLPDFRISGFLKRFFSKHNYINQETA